MTPNGRFVLFENSLGYDLAPNGSGYSDVFVRDLKTATTMPVSVNSTGSATGNKDSYPAAITPNENSTNRPFGLIALA
jgi:hypothetical protein